MNLQRHPPFWFVFLLLVRYLFKRYARVFRGPPERAEIEIRNKTVVITGGNTGLGKLTALEMANRGAFVVIGCRNLDAGQKAINDIKISVPSAKIMLYELNLDDFASVRRFCTNVSKKYPRIELLINNAGIFDPNDKIQHTKDNFEKHFAVNHLGHFLLTNLLLTNIKAAAPSRIITLGSTADFIEELSIDDLNFHKRTGISSYGYLMGRIFGKAYATSKFALSLFSYELSKRLVNTGVQTYCLCPGLVAGTELFRQYGPIDKFIYAFIRILIALSPQQGMETILYCALSKNCKQETGLYYQFSEPHPYENYRNIGNSQLAKLLWEESERLVGIKKDFKQN